MNNLRQIEQLLLPIWNKIYNKENCPKSFVKLMTKTVPKYKSFDYNNLFLKLARKNIIKTLREAQVSLIELNTLNKEKQNQLSILINNFEDSNWNLDINLESTYEVGSLFGIGGGAYFFKLRDYPNLGVRVLKEKTWSKNLLENELQKARILIKYEISIPKYIGIIEVYFPPYFIKSINKQTNLNYEDKKELENFANKIRYGLVIQNIESDLSLVSIDRMNYSFLKEFNKVKALGIKMGSDAPHMNNVLWSKKDAKIYFIDFERWIFPKKLYDLK